MFLALLLIATHGGDASFIPLDSRLQAQQVIGVSVFNLSIIHKSQAMYADRQATVESIPSQPGGVGFQGPRNQSIGSTKNQAGATADAVGLFNEFGKELAMLLARENLKRERKVLESQIPAGERKEYIEMYFDPELSGGAPPSNGIWGIHIGKEKTLLQLGYTRLGLGNTEIVGKSDFKTPVPAERSRPTLESLLRQESVVVPNHKTQERLGNTKQNMLRQTIARDQGFSLAIERVGAEFVQKSLQEKKIDRFATDIQKSLAVAKQDVGRRETTTKEQSRSLANERVSEMLINKTLQDKKVERFSSDIQKSLSTSKQEAASRETILKEQSRSLAVERANAELARKDMQDKRIAALNREISEGLAARYKVEKTAGLPNKGANPSTSKPIASISNKGSYQSNITTPQSGKSKNSVGNAVSSAGHGAPGGKVNGNGAGK